MRQIIRQLRAELKREVVKAERLIRQGEDIGNFFSRATRGLSSLGAYLVARRAGRNDLAERFATGAAAQHRSCPLYRQASLALIPAEFYPGDNLLLAPEANAPHLLPAEPEFSRRMKYRECAN